MGCFPEALGKTLPPPTSRLVEVFGTIHFQAVVGWRAPFPYWLSAGAFLSSIGPPALQSQTAAPLVPFMHLMSLTLLLPPGESFLLLKAQVIRLCPPG